MYHYVLGNPINMIDRLGLSGISSEIASAFAPAQVASDAVLGAASDSGAGQIADSLTHFGIDRAVAETISTVGEGIVSGAIGGAIEGGPVGAAIGGTVGPTLKVLIKEAQITRDVYFINENTRRQEEWQRSVERRLVKRSKYIWVRCVGKVRYEFDDWETFERVIRKK